MIILNSARKHGISDIDMLAVIGEPYVIAELREAPEKLLFLGFDTKARAIEVITDTGASGQVFVIHADLITRNNEKLLEEVLK
jgi:sulfur transfer complex TusBCD TusB component (DsrH family)